MIYRYLFASFAHRRSIRALLLALLGTLAATFLAEILSTSLEALRFGLFACLGATLLLQLAHQIECPHRREIYKDESKSSRCERG